MTDAPDPQAPNRNPTGCGVFAAIAFFLLAAFPVLIFAGMQGGACQGGPCHPERVVSSGTALAWLAGAALLVGIAVRMAAARRARTGAGWPAWVVAAVVVVLCGLAWVVLVG